VKVGVREDKLFMNAIASLMTQAKPCIHIRYVLKQSVTLDGMKKQSQKCLRVEVVHQI
jgi:hypothetical protein